MWSFYQCVSIWSTCDICALTPDIPADSHKTGRVHIFSAAAVLEQNVSAAFSIYPTIKIFTQNRRKPSIAGFVTLNRKKGVFLTLSLKVSVSPEAVLCGRDSLLHCSNVLLHWHGRGGWWRETAVSVCLGERNVDTWREQKEKPWEKWHIKEESQITAFLHRKRYRPLYNTTGPRYYLNPYVGWGGHR